MGKVSVVAGGQFGSEAKGAVAGYLSSADQNVSFWGDAREVVCVRVGGPNAGHTVYGRCPVDCTHAHIKMPGDENFEYSHPWRLRQVPVAVVTNPKAKLVIAAGSEVDFQVLHHEIQELNKAGYNPSSRLLVDKSATVLTARHIETEVNRNLSGRLGSTAKGIGAARAERLMREAMVVGDITRDIAVGYEVGDSVERLVGMLNSDAHVVIEGTQGFGLGLNTRFYPQCTSGNTRAVDFLAQTGISPWSRYITEFEVWVVARTKPIRVAGNSGPLKGETSWDELGLEPEKTTVTQKIRRVGEFDAELLREAIRANGGGDGRTSVVKVALMMVDYEIPNSYGVTDARELSNLDMGRLMELVWGISEQVGSDVQLIGTSPTTIMDLRR